MVAKEGSIVKACEKLHLSQPTISNQLKTLEQSLGQKLFQRTGRQLVLTDMGHRVFRYADEIFTIGQDLQHYLAGHQEGNLRQRLLIGITDSLPKWVSYRILEPLLNRQESLQFTCYEDDNLEGLLQRLATYELDFVVADAPMPPGSHFKAYNHLLGTCGISFFAVPEKAKAYRNGFPKSLDGTPMLLPSTNTALRGILEGWFQQEKIYPHIVGEFDDMALLKVFGQRGTGVFCLPTVTKDDVVENLGLELIGESDNVKCSFYAISVERRIRQPIIQELVDYARNNLFNNV
jgi:LysR family transcriptional activator of nhaA